MPEPRDRLSRPVDLVEVFAQRRLGILGVLSDESLRLLGYPVQGGPTRGAMGLSLGSTGGLELGRGSFGTSRSGIGRGRNVYRSPMGRENTPPPGSIRRGRGRASRSVLPTWYPRTPLRDITAVVRAIERRRARVVEGEGLTVENPASQDERVINPNISSSGARPEHDFNTPAPVPRKKMCPPSVRTLSEILHEFSSPRAGEPDFLTPQKKLLNSIDTVEKVVMEELQKLKRTPSAKKAEREKKVRTLMSMR